MGLFGIKSKKEKVEIELNDQIQEMNEFIAKLKEKKNLPAISTNLMLKKGEEAFMQCESTLYESRATSYSKGSSTGGGMRVMKGVYVGGSSRSSKSESRQELKAIDKGTLVMTNKRLIFSGLHESRNIPLNKIISFDPKIDSALITVENKVKKMYFTMQNAFVWWVALQVLIQAPDPHKLGEVNFDVNIK